MAGKRLALLIANAQYQHPKLRQLEAPPHDVRALEKVLEDPNIGGYEPLVLVDRTKAEVERAINRLLASGKREDLVLIFFAGHGLKHENGKLYFAMTDTEPDFLAGTAVSAGWLVEQMQDSHIGRQIVILDCCYGGAFGRSLRRSGDGGLAESGKVLEIPDLLENGRGQVVITATDAMQFAFEDGDLKKKPAESHFTRLLIEALSTGDADRNPRDGRITIDKLMRFLKEGLARNGSKQKPQEWRFGVSGSDLQFASNPRAYRGDTSLVGPQIKILPLEEMACLLCTLKGHTDRITALSFSPGIALLGTESVDKTVTIALLASGSRDKTVRLWRVSVPEEGLEEHASGELVQTLPHMDTVFSVAWSPDGKTLAAGSRDRSVKLWEPETGKLLATFDETGTPSCLAWSPDGKTLAAAGGLADNAVRLWHVASAKPINALQGHTKRVTSVAFSPDGALLASAALDSTFRLWRVPDGEPMRTQEIHRHRPVWKVTFSPDGEVLSAGTSLSEIWLWRVADGDLLRALEVQTGQIYGMTFSPEGNLLVATSTNKRTDGIWRVKYGHLECIIEGEEWDITNVTFSWDATLLASGARHGTVWLWSDRLFQQAVVIEGLGH